MNTGGLMTRIVKFVQGMIGFIRGGLAFVNVITNMIMAGMSGSALADAAATGTVLIPAMEKAGYSRAFAAALTAASGTIGPVIPPSIPFVIYAGIANLSVGKMFMAGAVPGVFMGIFLMVASYFISVKRGYGKEARQSLGQIFVNFRHALLALLMPVIILGGILSGVTTATEAAVVAVVYSLIVSMFIYKQITLKDLPNIIYKAAIDTAVIMFIISAASMFGWILGREQVPQHLMQIVESFTTSPWMVLLLLNIIFLILGMFMEGTSILIILTPVLLPLINAMGIDLYHFGVIIVLNLMIGLITPPVGMTLFITSRIAGLGVDVVAKEMIPFIIALVVLLLLITYWPALSLWLPSIIA